MSERQGGRGREVGHVTVAAEHGVEVAVGLRAGRPRQAHGQPPRRVDPAGEHPGDRAGPLLAGEEGLHHGGASLQGPADGVRPTGEQHQHDRRPVSSTASTSWRWTPGSSRSSRSHPSPTVPRPNRPDWSPTTSDGDVGGGRRPRPHRRCPDVVVVDPAAAADGDRRRTLGAQRLEHRRRRRCRLDVPGCWGIDVVDEGVAAEERLDPVGVRADHGHPPAGAPSGSVPSLVSSTTDSSASRARDPAVLGPVEVDVPPAAVARTSRRAARAPPSGAGRAAPPGRPAPRRPARSRTASASGAR